MKCVQTLLNVSQVYSDFLKKIEVIWTLFALNLKSTLKNSILKWEKRDENSMSSGP
jgi:hypothetical protein